MRSFWLEQALDAEPASPVPLDRDLRTDVCIVGGGFTGLWTALELKSRDPSVDVTLVEADLCGSGASGRNGGFVMTWMSIVYGHGYTGNGVGPSHLGGKFLTSLALGAKDEWAGSPMVEQRPVRFLPREPARYLGGQLVRAAARRKEIAEDAGRAPARLDKALAGLAPAGLAPVGKN